MQYEKRSILTDDQNPNGGTDREVEPFMVGTQDVLGWKSDQDRRGFTGNRLRPAYSADEQFKADGGRCWYRSWAFCAQEPGNISEGHGSELIPFEEGVRLLIEHEVFSFPVPAA